MKIKVLAILLLMTIFSCSNDSDLNEMSDGQTEANIVGEWNLTAVNFTGQNSSDLNLAAEIIDNLVDEQCYLVTFNFNGNGTATAEDKTNYIEVNATPTGLDVPCPTQSDIESSTWSLDGNQLTFINADMEEETIEITIDGDTMILDGEDVDADNYVGAQAVFTKS